MTPAQERQIKVAFYITPEFDTYYNLSYNLIPKHVKVSVARPKLSSNEDRENSSGILANVLRLISKFIARVWSSKDQHVSKVSSVDHEQNALSSEVDAEFASQDILFTFEENVFNQEFTTFAKMNNIVLAVVHWGQYEGIDSLADVERKIREGGIIHIFTFRLEQFIEKVQKMKCLVSDNT